MELTDDNEKEVLKKNLSGRKRGRKMNRKYLNSSGRQAIALW
jgi:hypothetical protein